MAFETKFYWINVKIDKTNETHTLFLFGCMSMINEQKIDTHTPCYCFQHSEKYLSIFVLFFPLVLQQQNTHHIDWHISMIRTTEFFSVYTRKSKIKNTINFVGR